MSLQVLPWVLPQASPRVSLQASPWVLPQASPAVYVLHAVQTQPDLARPKARPRTLVHISLNSSMTLTETGNGSRKGEKTSLREHPPSSQKTQAAFCFVLFFALFLMLQQSPLPS